MANGEEGDEVGGAWPEFEGNKAGERGMCVCAAVKKREGGRRLRKSKGIKGSL